MKWHKSEIQLSQMAEQGLLDAFKIDDSDDAELAICVRGSQFLIDEILRQRFDRDIDLRLFIIKGREDIAQMGVNEAGNGGNSQFAGMIGGTGGDIRMDGVVRIGKKLKLLIERFAIFGRQCFTVGPFEQLYAQLLFQKDKSFAGALG